MSDDTDAPEAAPAAQSASEPLTVKLRAPIQFGKEAAIEELVLKPTSRAFRDFEIPMREDGMVLYRPYPLALVGLKMAGHVVAAQNLIDKMDPKDMNTLAKAVFSFFV